MLQHFIIEGKHMGTAPRTPVRVHDRLSLPDSSAFFCPVCGDVWAQCPIVLEDGSVSPWMPWRMKCRKHAAAYSVEVPGSLFQIWDKPFNDAMPEAVLWWEFNRLLDCFPENEMETV